ncbi:MAG: hypothetical protein F4124_12635 [Acidimicrobiia bacterium]|nr:hypothetical protein [bacterium]MXW57545.1 hypothetical protein [Acidimicrobiia bacterium]MXZ84414.1 hypothetical protein [Acidimicrobiia bacterium]MYB75487.1 hypothetical protein [Acidimicrobiia bacterium]MYG72845.1 hypothetical protein [Acidimicrobiia bacterium]
MYIPIVLLSLGLAVAVATGSLADHGNLITSRNLAAMRAERAADAFIDGCGGGGCRASAVNTTRLDGTRLSGCIQIVEGNLVLRVEGQVPWSPRVFTGLTPASAVTAVQLGGFGPSATTVLASC